MNWKNKMRILSSEDSYAEKEEKEEVEFPRVNELFIQSFVNEYQPESDLLLADLVTFSMGELREVLQIYRTYDSKEADPLPYYLARLESFGFHVQMGFDGELVVPVSRRKKAGHIVVPEDV